LEFKASFPSSKIKYEHSKIVNLYIDGVEKHISKTRVEQLQIPNGLTIPNLKHCKIITDQYFLNVIIMLHNYCFRQIIELIFYFFLG